MLTVIASSSPQGFTQYSSPSQDPAAPCSSTTGETSSTQLSSVDDPTALKAEAAMQKFFEGRKKSELLDGPPADLRSRLLPETPPDSLLEPISLAPHYDSLKSDGVVSGEEAHAVFDMGEYQKMFPETVFASCYKKILGDCPGIRKLIKDDSATMYKQMIAWVIRCGLTGAFWTAGFTLGAILDKADSSTAGNSKYAWVGAAMAQGLAEMLCVTFIGYYLSHRAVTFKSDSNDAGLLSNVVEGMAWGASCLPAGTLWQKAVNTFCTTDDLSRFAPSCMAKVGASTGATFGATLACIKALIALKDHCCTGQQSYFRPFNFQNTISDSVLFGLIVVGTADAFFVLTSSNSPFNYKPYSTSTQYQLLPTLNQMALSALSTMLGGLTAYALRGGLRMMASVPDGEIVKSLREYRRALSLNSQCVIL
ncbi:hypothetical protein AAKU67_001125 [Oxalobacteraceae bacterium GrIS 2.11]